ncbi:MAG: hypothetical protein ABL997_02010 [Planctomycetota bacterium]
MTAPLLDKQEVALIGTGFVLGVLLMAALIAVGLLLNLSPSIQFGIPYQ